MCESLVNCDVHVNAMKKHRDLEELGQKKNDNSSTFNSYKHF